MGKNLDTSPKINRWQKAYEVMWREYKLQH